VDETNSENVHTTENTEEGKALNYETEFIEMRDKYTRLYAEFDNYRKRTNRERADLIKTATEELMKELLPVLDDFERAEKSVQNSNDNKAQVAEEALLILHKRLKSTLEKKGLKPMENSIGKNLDADLHEAITQVPAPDESLKDKIIDEIEKGYYLHDKIIRFARVIVGT
jgi:molecular chaperone GrpE